MLIEFIFMLLFLTLFLCQYGTQVPHVHADLEYNIRGKVIQGQKISPILFLFYFFGLRKINS